MDDSKEGVPFFVPLNVGPSAESRKLALLLGAVPIHCYPVTFPKQDVLLEKLHKEGILSKYDCTHDCSGSR